MRSKRRNNEVKEVDPEVTANAFAKAVYEGDIVNFRLLFGPFSPARAESTERFDTAKYAYLLPDDEMAQQPRFLKCLDAVERPETMAHIEKELEANRPAQLPSDLILMLADNAVWFGKYTLAAQAYELLRVRTRMQDEFFKQADAALDEHDVPKAVRGYLIATGLAYDYAAFPEPLPVVPGFQTRALLLHGEYPDTPEKCVGMKDADTLMQTALGYLLLDPQAAARLEKRPFSLGLAFLVELVHQRDPRWNEFAVRYREASSAMDEYTARLEQAKDEPALLEDLESELGKEAQCVQAQLLGRTVQKGEWWQYLKDMAYEHPPSALFVARQALGEHEFLVPRCKPGSPIARELGLLTD